MRMTRHARPALPVVACLLALGICTALPASAQEGVAPATAPPTENKPAPYDGRMERLSEILGAVHYLRNLCLKDGEDSWRKAMEELIAMEAGNEQARKERLTAAFNRGYRSFASVYATCTGQAVVAEERYRNEGATLAAEITARFGN